MTPLTPANPIDLPSADGAIEPCSTHVESARPSLLADYIALTKPRIGLMVVITAWIGFALGTTGSLAQYWLALLATLIGTGLCCAGAAIFNQVYERDTDALMHRTRNRPLPAGRVAPAPAMVYASLLSLTGLGLLASLTTFAAAGVALLTILSYAVVYTPMKRRSSFSTWVGAIPGALPPVIGFAAATGRIGEPAIACFALMFVWQIPHFLAITWLHRDDFARAGFPMLAVLDPAGSSTFRQSVLTCIVLIPVSLLPTLWGISGWTYFAIALLAGGAFLAATIRMAVLQSTTAARTAFFVSLIHLPVVLVAMMADRI